MPKLSREQNIERRRLCFARAKAKRIETYKTWSKTYGEKVRRPPYSSLPPFVKEEILKDDSDFYQLKHFLRSRRISDLNVRYLLFKLKNVNTRCMLDILHIDMEEANSGVKPFPRVPQ